MRMTDDDDDDDDDCDGKVLIDPYWCNSTFNLLDDDTRKAQLDMLRKIFMGEKVCLAINIIHGFFMPCQSCFDLLDKLREAYPDQNIPTTDQLKTPYNYNVDLTVRAHWSLIIVILMLGDVSIKSLCTDIILVEIEPQYRKYCRIECNDGLETYIIDKDKCIIDNCECIIGRLKSALMQIRALGYSDVNDIVDSTIKDIIV